MRLLVTGASGYIGSRLVAAAAGAGHSVIAATRRPVPGLAWYPFDLATTLRAPLPDDLGAIVHLAAVTDGAGGDTQAPGELAAAMQLVQAARERGARFVFVSSQTARADAPTAYGRTKWAIEQVVLSEGGVVVRPGQVYGGGRRGLFGTLVGLVKRVPVLPAFVPPPCVQPVHVDDLAAALLAAVDAPQAPGRVFRVADPRPVSFTDFLRAIARRRLGIGRLFVPVPAVAVTLARRLARGRINALERLASLFALPRMESAADLRELGITLRPLEEGMASGSRRLLVRESRTLLRYVLGEVPRPGLVARQVRAVEALRGSGQALRLPGIAQVLPGSLAWLDERGSQGEFQWRLDAATAIAEASPQGARRFLSSRGLVLACVGMAVAVAAEVFWRATGWLARPLVGRG
jgi:nucleoside-diphosphate-sugar epimerase